MREKTIEKSLIKALCNGGAMLFLDQDDYVYVNEEAVLC
jgi:hypothetical protein